jgi:Ca-activated chloride channel family protein
VIIPPEEVHADTFVATVGYNYPLPQSAVGLNLFAGHRQVSNSGQEEILRIGIQGGKQEFDDLPPLNLAFVIDKSGSRH